MVRMMYWGLMYRGDYEGVHQGNRVGCGLSLKIDRNAPDPLVRK